MTSGSPTEQGTRQWTIWVCPDSDCDERRLDPVIVGDALICDNYEAHPLGKRIQSNPRYLGNL